MEQDKIEQIWDKIRIIESENLEFYIANAYNETRDKICQFFIDNPLLNDYYIKKLSNDELIKKYNVTTIQRILNMKQIILSHLKVALAEDGIFDDIEYKNNAIYYTYILKRIKKYGITYVNIVDEVSKKDIATALGCFEISVNKKIKSDCSILKNRLESLNIKVNKNLIYLYLDIYPTICKDPISVCDDSLLQIKNIVLSNTKLKKVFNSGYYTDLPENFDIEIDRIKNKLNNSKTNNILL